MAMENQLIELIEKLVEEKTFSLEGAKAIAQLKVSVESNNTKLREYESKVNDYMKRNEDLIGQIRKLSETVEEYRKQEEGVKKRESHTINNELRVAVAEAKADTIETMFQTLFKNTIVRENIQRKVVTDVAPTYSGGIPTVSIRDGNEDKKITVTE